MGQCGEILAALDSTSKHEGETRGPYSHKFMTCIGHAHIVSEAQPPYAEL